MCEKALIKQSYDLDSQPLSGRVIKVLLRASNGYSAVQGYKAIRQLRAVTTPYSVY